MDERNASTVGRRTGYQNGALTAIAVLLGMMVVQHQTAPGQGLGPAVAAASTADDTDGGGRINAAEQRKQLIAELAKLNQTISRLDARVAGTMNVKVTDMPQVRIAGGDPAPGAATKP